MNTIKFSFFVLSLIIILTIFLSCGEKQKLNLDRLNDEEKSGINSILEKAGENSEQLKIALTECPESQMNGLLFLLRNMPDRDLKNLSSEFLLENIAYAYRAINEVKWGKEIPDEIFLNYVLPYANLHERRDNWRKDFYKKFLPLVIDLTSPSEATIKLNQDIWDIINVKYSTKRPKADQSPYESIDVGLASCTGLSIILIDACRAVGIPARFVGVPLWKDESGNHSWVEIWDDGWHYIGAAEQSPLNNTWFGERAKTSDDSNWKYSIYAVSFEHTEVIFPPLFDTTATYVYANIVTDRYSEELTDDGLIAMGVRLFDRPEGNRIEADISVLQNGRVIKKGKSKDEKHDYNDFLVFRLDPNKDYRIKASANNKSTEKEITTDNVKYQFVELYLNE